MGRAEHTPHLHNLQSSRCNKLQNQTKMSLSVSSPLFGSSFRISWLKNCPNFLFQLDATLDIEWRGNNSAKSTAKSGLPWTGAGCGRKPANCYPWKQAATAESSIFTRKLLSQVENVPKRYLNLAPLFARTCQQQIAAAV